MLLKLILPACAVLLLAFPACACPDIKGEDVNDTYVQAFIKAAEKVDAPCPVSFAQDDDGRAIIKYLPEGEALDAWKTLFMANVVPVGEDPAPSVTEDMAKDLVKRIKGEKGDAKIVASESNRFGKLHVVRYSLGADDQKAQAVAVVRFVGPDKAAIIHWQKRGAEISDDDVTLFTGINGIDEEEKKEEAPSP